MTTPEQQPNNPVDPNGGNAAEPGVASAPSSTPQPAYGQYANPDYGAMRSQYGPNYNPYLYGAPDPDPKTAEAAAQGQTNQAGRPYPYQQSPQSSQSSQSQPYQQYPQYPGAANRPVPPDGHTPRYIYGVDVNDPNQNPLYGHWDSYAIIAFVFAMIFSVPLLPAIMGAASLWRIRTFHMKGRGFAIAAIIVNLLTTAVQVWMVMNGVSVLDLYSDLYNMYVGGSGSSDDMLSA